VYISSKKCIDGASDIMLLKNIHIRLFLGAILKKNAEDVVENGASRRTLNNSK